jgi:hypothetical protein
MGKYDILIEYPESDLLLKYDWIRKCTKLASKTKGMFDYEVPPTYYKIYSDDYQRGEGI